MNISNKKQTVFLRRLFFLVCLVLALVALAMFLLDYMLYGLVMVGVFVLWYLFFQVADYHFIEYSDSGDKVVLRYYKSIRFGRTSFNSIEFPKRMLYRAYFENSIFGKMSDLTLVVKTRRGIAEYPSVSLSAVPLSDRKMLQERLLHILGV